VVTAISPDFGYENKETEVSITGDGFKTDALVKLGGTDLLAIEVVSDELITATVPSGMEPGTYMLVVANQDGSTGSLPDAFEVREKRDSGCGCGLGSRGSASLLLILGCLALAVRRRE
jgi:hypothetical protein